MAALVQTFTTTQQSSTTPVSLMQPRSQNPSGALHNNSTNSSAVHHQHQQHQARINNTPSRYRDVVGANSTPRAGYNSAPVATYAFTSTPGLDSSKPNANSSTTTTSQAPNIANRTSSLGRSQDSRQQSQQQQQQQQQQHGYTSLEAISPDQSVRPPASASSRSADDLAAAQTTRPNLRPLSTSTTTPQVPFANPSPSRPSPDRYRKVNRRSDVIQSAQPSGSGMAAVAAVYTNTTRTNSSPSLPTNQNAQQGAPNAPFIGDYAGQLRSQSVDDIHAYRHPSASQPQVQGRRRSVGPASLNTTENFQNFLRSEMAASQNKTGGVSPVSPVQARHAGELKVPHRPGSRRTGSTDSSASGASSRASTASNRNSVVSNSSNPSHAATHEINPANIPPRGASNDVNKRTTAPSPLSKSMLDIANEQPAPKPATPNGGSSIASRPQTARPGTATEHLTALNESQKKGMKNRLRRAFSFGSASELRKASLANSARADGTPKTAAELEQERIAARQAAAGLGENIYSGQGNFFTGSTDNVSVSSTASSASIMIRKMGKGMKRTSRSFVGLFRPKSITGVAPASGPIDTGAGAGPVSMITVEAERERVNVNARPAEQDGGTGFPKLDRNSIDAAAADQPRRGSVASERNNAATRQSFLGAERERAEILATMKKGILKRSGSASPIIRAQDRDKFGLPEIPHVSGESLDGAGDRTSDYFANPPKVSSAPASPNAMTKYNVSFSPRITFHETWTSGEYDRRAEVATCNRLTPMLAQQIKEELNTFKMEMDVHEESKVYTHFF